MIKINEWCSSCRGTGVYQVGGADGIVRDLDCKDCDGEGYNVREIDTAPRTLKIVKLDQDAAEREGLSGIDRNYLNGMHLVMIGELEQMPGRCIIADEKGLVHWGYRTSLFVPLTEDEV